MSILVALNGAYILATTLLDQVSIHHRPHLSAFVVDLPLLLGISLIYLGSQLSRQKRTAWQVTVVVYAFYLGLGVAALINLDQDGALNAIDIIRRSIIPITILSVVYLFRREFYVKSDIQGFRTSTIFATGVICVALIYGVAGFLLLDNRDFHQQIGVTEAVHYTVDQFDLTTNTPLQPATRRGHIFADSLSAVSIIAVVYVALALFQPLKNRLGAQDSERQIVEGIMSKYGASSEEFFKLWPHDKHFYINEDQDCALAYHVYRGVALNVGDPVGNPKKIDQLLADFNQLCFSNDWLTALVHVGDVQQKMYQKNGYTLQKLGQEAVLNIEHFQTKVAGTKYFRQINNKFTKQGHTTEILSPPHHQAVISRLSTISADWLKQGSRAERGFVMGYYTEEYIQKCEVIVVRDAAGTIQAFSNLIPADYDKEEATFDLLRHSNNSLGNINDFLLMGLINGLKDKNYSRINLGFCPLVGLDDIESEKRTLIDRVLKFAYANGDRFYSFNGLHRFKNKYQPEWHDKYLGYQGGIRGFSRTINAVIRAMKVSVKTK